MYQGAFARWVIGVENEPSITLQKDWKRVTDLPQILYVHGKGAILLSVTKPTTLDAVGARIGLKHQTKNQTAYMDFGSECWDECVKIFLNPKDGGLLIKEELERQPMVKFYKKYFHKSWLYLENLCEKKVNGKSGPNDGEDTDSQN